MREDEPVGTFVDRDQALATPDGGRHRLGAGCASLEAIHQRFARDAEPLCDERDRARAVVIGAVELEFVCRHCPRRAEAREARGVLVARRRDAGFAASGLRLGGTKRSENGVEARS